MAGGGGRVGLSVVLAGSHVRVATVFPQFSLVFHNSPFISRHAFPLPSDFPPASLSLSLSEKSFFRLLTELFFLSHHLPVRGRLQFPSINLLKMHVICI